MTLDISKLVVIVKPEDKIDQVIRRMVTESSLVAHAGLAVALDSRNRVLGVVTDGDIRRAYVQGISWDEPVSTIMVKQPITIPIETNRDRIIFELSQRIGKAPHLAARMIPHILVVDKTNRLLDIKDFVDLMWDRDERSAGVYVIGMGFVGLTLAVALANVGHNVTGVDIDTDLVEQLQHGESRIYEKGLVVKLKHALERGGLKFRSRLEEDHSSIFIIAVGTPIKNNNQADLSDLKTVAMQLSKVLKVGDMVMLRSTVPVGTTRKCLLQILEKGSGLTIAEHYNLAFTPERTLAGKALRELNSLPQLIGGITVRCSERAARFWSTLTHTVIQLPSPEAAEIAKLANNSFRNLSFAFSNELSALASEHNLDVNEIIQAANKGYPRNPIPLASPGVGGYCLPKDSILLASSFERTTDQPSLSAVATSTNKSAGLYTVEIVENFCADLKLPITSINVLIVGIAFKGEPETNDLRGSIGVVVAKGLTKKGANVIAWDAVVTREELILAGLEPTLALDETIRTSDVILIMNNHRDNGNIDLTMMESTGDPKLIYDGWGLFDKIEMEAIENFYFSSPGYMTRYVS